MGAKKTESWKLIDEDMPGFLVWAKRHYTALTFVSTRTDAAQIVAGVRAGRVRLPSRLRTTAMRVLAWLASDPRRAAVLSAALKTSLERLANTTPKRHETAAPPPAELAAKLAAHVDEIITARGKKGLEEGHLPQLAKFLRSGLSPREWLNSPAGKAICENPQMDVWGLPNLPLSRSTGYQRLSIAYRVLREHDKRAQAYSLAAFSRAAG